MGALGVAVAIPLDGPRCRLAYALPVLRMDGFKEVCTWVGSGLNGRPLEGSGRDLRRKNSVTFSAAAASI
jgi:hypothetical protein